MLDDHPSLQLVGGREAGRLRVKELRHYEVLGGGGVGGEGHRERERERERHEFCLILYVQLVNF